jgi:ABC-2 type transport system ATP-binding protein
MIVTEKLCRYYGGKVALSELSLTVAAGEILGFLGPNGAGKSTTVKILAGLIKPSSGRADVAGFDVVRQPLEVKRRIGYVPESAALYESLTAREFLELVASLHHQPREAAEQRIDELLGRFDLGTSRDQRLSEFSKGMKQKVLIASALMHGPEVLFLDEPLTGLDANAALVVKKLIRGLAAQGRTIFFCSHVLEVVERICTRIVIIDRGRTVADGTAAEIAARTNTRSLEAAFVALTGAGMPAR